MELKTLIDRAAGNMLRGREGLAEALGVSTKRLADWRYGVRPMPMEKQVVLCDVARLNDEECRAHLREQAGAPAPKLRGVAASIALAVSGGALAAAIYNSAASWASSTMYTPSRRGNALRQS